MKKLTSLLFVSIFGLALSQLVGCASIVNGTQQKVNVETPPAAGANCTLTNGKGKWYVNNTPGVVSVHRSYDDLVVECEKHGYEDASSHIKSKTKGMAYGNILFGGGIGAGIDIANGSAYDYPEKIQVPMISTG